MSMTNEEIASICHAANIGLQLLTGEDVNPPWDEAPQWMKDSAVAGVRGVLEDGNTPEQSHESWMAERLGDGWVYGPVKDIDAKQHPCLVPYDELPELQRAKDHVFRQVALTLGRGI